MDYLNLLQIKYKQLNSMCFKLLFFLVTICFLFSCKTATQINNRPINEALLGYIQSNCNFEKTCRMELAKATEFSWDHLYVFDIAVEDNIISEKLGVKFNSVSQFYSQKWFFVKDGQIIQAEEKVIEEIDNPIKNGDIDFEIKDSQNKFALFDENSVFEVEEMKIGSKKYYYLKCNNCK